MRADELLLEEYVRGTESALAQLLVETALQNRGADEEALASAVRQQLEARLEEMIGETGGH